MARNSNDVTTRILDIQVRYEDALDQIAAYRKAIEETKARQKELKKELDEGTITQAEYGRQMEASRISIAEQNNSINTLTKQIRNQQKVEQEQLGSLVQLRAQLSNLNADYDRLSKKEREGAKGHELLDKINETTTTLKAAEEATQRYFRNVGNYPGYEGAATSSAEDLSSALTGQVKTIADAEKQNKALREAIRQMDLSADDAKEKIAEYNAKIEENTAMIKANSATVKSADSAMATHASTINEAKEQNSILTAAINDIDLTADGAMEKIAEYNARIAENAELIKSATSASQSHDEAVSESSDAVETLDEILSQNVRTVKEVEEQNKKLKEALDNLDLTAPNVQEEIDRINERLENNRKLTEKTTDANQELADKLGSMLGINLNFGKSLEGLSANSASSGNAIKALTSNVSAFAKTLMTLLANPAVLAFLGIAGTLIVAKWIFDYNKNLQEATRLTEEFTGMTGKAMKSMRSEIIGVADTYGKDFNEVLAAADGLVSQFGISFEDAMQTIKDGFVAGSDLNGNFLEQLGKYPAAFREAGLSASQMTAMIAQTRSGIFSEQGMEVIEEANKKFREMSQATKDALSTIGMSAEQALKDVESGEKSMFDIYQEVAGKLDELPESSEAAGKVMKEVFGEKGVEAGYELITCLKDIDTNLESVKGQTGEVGKMEEQVMESQIELENKLAAVFDMTGGSFETLTGQFKVLTNEALSALLDILIDVCNWFINLYNDAVYVRTIVKSVGLAFNLLWDIIKVGVKAVGNSFKLLGGIISSVANALSGLFTRDFDKAVAGVKQLGTAVTDFYKNQKDLAVDTIKEMAQDTVDTINGINDKLEPIDMTVTKDNAPDNGSSGTTLNNPAPKVVDSAADKTKSDNAKKEAEAAKKAADEERKLMEQLQAEMLKLVKEGAEKRRKVIEEGYDKQIRDLQYRLTTEKDLTVKSRETITKIIESLELQKQAALKKLSDEELKRTYEDQVKINEAKLAAMKVGSNHEFALQQENLRMAHELALKEAETAYEDEIQKQEAIAALRAKYAAESAAIEDERKQKDLEITKQHLQNQIDALDMAETERQLHRQGWQNLDAQEYEEHKRMMLESIAGAEAAKLQMEEEFAQQEYERLVERGQLSTQTEEEWLAEQNEAKNKWLDKQKAINDAYIKNEEAKAQAMKAVTSSLTGLLDTLGESNKAFAMMSKVITLAQIAIDTGKALSAGIASASSVPFPGNLAAIGTTVATVLANIATAISTVKSAKFAQGGKVSGPGTGTSDSVPALLSHGEYVMTAKATKMFEPLLEAMNGIGSGVPMQVVGSTDSVESAEMLTSSFESAAKEIKPVVSVVEINEVQQRVETIEELDTF